VAADGRKPPQDAGRRGGTLLTSSDLKTY
jgi:hypothetical protein